MNFTDNDKKELCGYLKITEEKVEHSANAINKDKRYSFDNKVLKKLFAGGLKQEPEDFYIQVVMLNSSYSTRMGADECYKMADYLQVHKEKLQQAINSGEIDKAVAFINDMKCGVAKNKKSDSLSKFYYSFITKLFSNVQRYSSNSEKDDFPIFDNIVCRMLKLFKKLGLIDIAAGFDFTDYAQYAGLMRGLKDSLDADVTYKELDNYMWWTGKKIETAMKKIAEKKQIEQKTFHADCLDKFLQKTGMNANDFIKNIK